MHGVPADLFRLACGIPGTSYLEEHMVKQIRAGMDLAETPVRFTEGRAEGRFAKLGHVGAQIRPRIGNCGTRAPRYDVTRRSSA